MRRIIRPGALLLLLLFSTGLHAQPAAPQSTQFTEPGRVNLYFPLIAYAGHLDREVAAAIEEQIHQAAVELLLLTFPYGSPFGSYEVHLESERILSLTLTVGGYRPPAAHPMTYARSLTFDLTSGRLLGLENLFNGEYLALISNLIQLQIEESEDELPLLRPFSGIDSSVDFYLTPQGLVVYFQLYDLLPYAWGFPAFLIPYSDLCRVVADEYRFLLGETGQACTVTAGTGATGTSAASPSLMP